MIMEVLKEKDMKLLSRKRLTLLVENKGATPSRQDLVKEIAKKFKTDEELVIIKHIYQQFGKNKTKLMVHIYEDKDKMKIFEHANLLKKHEVKIPEPVKEESAVKVPAQEAPKEALKEEPKADEPKTEESKAKEAKKEEVQAPEEKVEEKK